MILERLNGPVDLKQRDHQAGSRQDRSCTDQIRTLHIIIEQSIECRLIILEQSIECRLIIIEQSIECTLIIIEQSIEWNSAMYKHFVDYEKAFDSGDRYTLWVLLRHHAVPQKFVILISNSDEGISCRVVHDGQMVERFRVMTGVRQDALTISVSTCHRQDHEYHHHMKEKWDSVDTVEQFDDLDVAGDLALLSHTQQ